jgi:hypothetical protein
MKKIIIIAGIFILIGICVAGALYIQTKKITSTTLDSQENVTVPASPGTTISLPPKEQQQQVIMADEKKHEPLSLTIVSPANNSTVTNPKLIVKGKTAPGAEVFVNETEGVADVNGNFSLTISLDEGDNPVIVMANDADGNVAEQDLNIIYNAGE